MPKYILNTSFSNYKFPMTDVNSPTIGKTGLAVSIEISNDAGSFSSSVGSVTELQSGWYNLNIINSTEMVSGSIALVGMASGANDWRDVIIPESDSINITNSAADLILTRTLSHTETAASTDRCLHRAIAVLINKSDFSGDTTWQVYKSNDSDVLFSITTSGDNSAIPIVSIDPD
jgi:hypothetical protein